MAGPILNKQPLFVGTIRMVTTTFDPNVITNHYNMDATWSTAPTPVYTAVGDYGDIIDRITISATADLGNTNVSAKLIYIYLGDYDTNTANYTYSLYKTLAMPATTISNTVPNPELELVMQGGLLLNTGDKILIGASTNYGTTSQPGDAISVTVEGGTYNSQ